jgi:hypothetical protein
MPFMLAAGPAQPNSILRGHAGWITMKLFTYEFRSEEGLENLFLAKL